MQFEREIREASKPTRDLVFSQVTEALKTGGVEAQIPSIQRSVEASRGATSSALRGLDEDLASSGLGRTGFGARARAETLLAGESGTANIPTAMAADWLSVAPSLALGSSAQSIGALTSAAGIGTQQRIAGSQIQAQRDIAKGNQNSQMVSSLFGALASGAGAAAGCWIAARLYGAGSLEYHAARWWIFDGWHGRGAALVRWAYLRYGERVARLPRWALLPLKPAFDVAVRRGLAHQTRVLG